MLIFRIITSHTNNPQAYKTKQRSLLNAKGTNWIRTTWWTLILKNNQFYFILRQTKIQQHYDVSNKLIYDKLKLYKRFIMQHLKRKSCWRCLSCCVFRTEPVIFYQFLEIFSSKLEKRVFQVYPTNIFQYFLMVLWSYNMINSKRELGTVRNTHLRRELSEYFLQKFPAVQKSAMKRFAPYKIRPRRTNISNNFFASNAA